MKHLNSLVGKHLRPISKKIWTTHSDTGTNREKGRLIQRRIPQPVLTASGDDVLNIACPDPTAEDIICDAHYSRAQRMVRQERWDHLITAIELADQNRQMTPGAMPVADLLAYGARADVTQAAEHALMDGRPAKGAPVLAGIEALEHVLAEFPESLIIAAIVAQAHMDIAWAWRGNGWDEEVPPSNLEAFEAHFDRASDILERVCHKTSRSAFLVGTCCALMGGKHMNGDRITDKYEALIELNHANPRPMRAMGNHLLPRWHGSYAQLELEARRTAARTAQTWGAGGYTWVQFDAITTDDAACANLDVDFFIDGLRDILDRQPDPYTTNLLAAYCTNAVGQSYSGHPCADDIRSEIAKCAQWIVREHLTELHPLIWAHAASGFDNNLRVASPARFAASGRQDAMNIILNLFSSEIAAGQRIVFTDAGPEAQT